MPSTVSEISTLFSFSSVSVACSYRISVLAVVHFEHVLRETRRLQRGLKLVASLLGRAHRLVAIPNGLVFASCSFNCSWRCSNSERTARLERCGCAAEY